uniref:ADP-ribose/CDP-alcohol diphosphatase, manganese dependent n=1 Tax=Hucho hucho TaxID=62062 RepID=A0A4W5QIC2_9TELE
MRNCVQPLFTFGIVTDIQYADMDDGFNFKHTRKRYYSNSLQPIAQCTGEVVCGKSLVISMYIISVQPSKYRFVVLDAYDVSVPGREESSVQYHQAIGLLKTHNDNDLNHPPAPTGLEQRFVFNGGLSQDQLHWLEGDLLLVSTDPISLAHKSVVCFMAGQDHDCEYHRDDCGVHYLTLEGVIERPKPPHRTDRMFLKGYGRMSDRILNYP